LARELFVQGTTDARIIQSRVEERLRAEDLKIDYVALVDPDTLAAVEVVDRPTVVAIAAHVGKTRLIDNDIIG
jgi:pantoate--beta-alanine ligase